METEFIIEGRTGRVVHKKSKEAFVVITRQRALFLLTLQVTLLSWHQFNNKELLIFLEEHYPNKNYVIKSRFFIWLFFNNKTNLV